MHPRSSVGVLKKERRGKFDGDTGGRAGEDKAEISYAALNQGRTRITSNNQKLGGDRMV